MKKIKIFQENTRGELEKDINNWIDENERSGSFEVHGVDIALNTIPNGLIDEDGKAHFNTQDITEIYTAVILFEFVDEKDFKAH